MSRLKKKTSRSLAAVHLFSSGVLITSSHNNRQIIQNSIFCFRNMARIQSHFYNEHHPIIHTMKLLSLIERAKNDFGDGGLDQLFVTVDGDVDRPTAPSKVDDVTHLTSGADPPPCIGNRSQQRRRRRQVPPYYNVVLMRIKDVQSIVHDDPLLEYSLRQELDKVGGGIHLQLSSSSSSHTEAKLSSLTENKWDSTTSSSSLFALTVGKILTRHYQIAVDGKHSTKDRRLSLTVIQLITDVIDRHVVGGSRVVCTHNSNSMDVSEKGRPLDNDDHNEDDVDDDAVGPEGGGNEREPYSPSYQPLSKRNKTRRVTGDKSPTLIGPKMFFSVL